jgi:hypothetical protein
MCHLLPCLTEELGHGREARLQGRGTLNEVRTAGAMAGRGTCGGEVRRTGKAAGVAQEPASHGNSRPWRGGAPPCVCAGGSRPRRRPHAVPGAASRAGAREGRDARQLIGDDGVREKGGMGDGRGWLGTSGEGAAGRGRSDPVTAP